MPDKSFADLLREAGVQPSGAIQYAQSLNRPVPYRSYTPPRPLPRRMRPADVRAYDDNAGVAQQAMGEMRRDRMTGQDAMLREAQGPASNQFADAGMVALETTGVPALRRSYDAFEAGDPRQGIYEGIWGGLGLAGTLGAIPGARRGAPRLPTREPVLPQMREPPAPPPGSVLPVRPPQPFRQSLIGGADDLTGASRGVFSEGPPDGMPPRAPDAGAGRGTQLTREQAHARLQSLLDDAAKLEADTRATSQSIADMRDAASAAREQMRAATQRMSEVITPQARPAAPTEKLEFPQDPDQLRVFLERLRTEGPDALLAEQRARSAPDAGSGRAGQRVTLDVNSPNERSYNSPNTSVIIERQPGDDAFSVSWGLRGRQPQAMVERAGIEREGIEAAIQAIRLDAQANPSAAYQFQGTHGPLIRRYRRMAEQAANAAGFTVTERNGSLVLRPQLPDGGASGAGQTTRVYHATDVDGFDVPTRANARRGEGISVTPSRDVASEYGRRVLELDLRGRYPDIASAEMEAVQRQWAATRAETGRTFEEELLAQGFDGYRDGDTIFVSRDNMLSRAQPNASSAPELPDGGARGGEQFDTGRVVYRGLGRQYDPANGGYYQSFTSSLDDAREYGSNVVAAHIRPGRNLAVDGGGRNFNVLGVEQLPADVRARLHPSVNETATTDQIAHAAREAGYDSVTVRNVHDNRWGERQIAGAEPRTIDFVFSTENIRPLDSVPPQATGARPASGEKVRLSAADRALLDELLGPDAPTAGPSRPPPDTAKSYRPGPPKGGFFFPRTPVNGS